MDDAVDNDTLCFEVEQHPIDANTQSVVRLQLTQLFNIAGEVVLQFAQLLDDPRGGRPIQPCEVFLGPRFELN